MVCICKFHPRGNHISVDCSICGTRGNTKNIDYIGARTVYVNCPHDIKNYKHNCSNKFDIEEYRKSFNLYQLQGRSEKEVNRLLLDNGLSEEDIKLLKSKIHIKFPRCNECKNWGFLFSLCNKKLSDEDNNCVEFREKVYM